MTNKDEGFTLIELLVVIGIIVALAAVTVPLVTKFAGKGDEGALEAETQTVQTAMDTMMAEHGITAVTANDKGTVSNGQNTWTALPAGTGAATLDPYLKKNATKFIYCWGSSGNVYAQNETDGVKAVPDGVTQQTVAPDPDEGQTGCPLDRHIVWNVTLLPTLQPYESVVLTFGADRSGALLSDGNYCNEAWAEPGDDNTKTGMTAAVKVGSVAEDNDVCEGTEPGAKVTKIVSQIVDAVPTGSPLPSDTYQLTVEYSKEVENVGPVSLNLGPSGATGYGIRDLLPLGFCFVDDSATFQGASLANPSTNIPQGSNLCPSSDTRQRLDWDFSESIPSGETRTLVYRTSALVSAGNYRSDLLANFTEFTDPAVYTWPTAMVMVRDSFIVDATVDGRAIVSIDVSMGGSSGSIVDFVIE